MYHRFDENKYPSTNIKMEIFKKHIDIILKKNFEFYLPSKFSEEYNSKKSKKKVLLTIDDAFSSFYNNAWPLLKKNKIPFILFVSTEPVGKNGYMTWDQIREIEKESFVSIGNHSHSHNYLVNSNFNEFKKDIDLSIKLFKKNLGYNPSYFSYPFGEYNLKQKNYIKEKFILAFGQHSGVIDVAKDKYEIPRFPINEKYGDLDRFSFLVDLLPLYYRSIKPKERIISSKNNPPNLTIEFFNDQKNIQNINCFSNDGKDWGSPKLFFDNNLLIVTFDDKFEGRRGRINCSLNDSIGWRWFGLQFINPSKSD